MPRIHRSLALLAVLFTLGVVLAGCESGSTGPQTTPSAYAGSYNGIAEGAGVNGTVAITVGQVSTDLTRGPLLHAEGGNPDAVTLTLATTTGSITLTGTITGNMATVTSTTPPATCTITFTTTGASGNCTEAPYGTFPLIAFVIVNGIEATVYCGTQSPGEFAAFFPSATLGAVVSGPNMYLVVAPPTGTPTLYSGTIASNTVSLTSTSSGGAVYSGTLTGTASISGTITSGGSGSWAVANPCSQGVLTVSTNAVPASASVGSTTTITPTPVTITNSGGSGSTLGVLAVGAPTYTPSATSGWLQASLTSPTTMGGMLSLSVTPPSGIAAGTYTAAVPVTASLGTGSPQTVTVTLTINAGVMITSSSPLMACVDLINCNNQLTATGGSGAYAWSLASGSSLPSWLTLAPGGLLTGTAPAGVVYPATAPLTFSVTATDGTTSATKQFQITVYANVTITSTSPLPAANFGVPYSYQFMATGGPTSNYGWTLGLGNVLPSWLSLTTAGVLSGTPPAGAASPVTFTVVVTSGGSTAYLPVSLPITANAGPLAISTTTLPQAAVGVAYNDVGVLLAATGGTPPYKWSVTAGTPPAGITVTLAGLVYGTPTTTGSSTFTVTVTDASAPPAQTASKQLTLVVNPALTITSSNLPNAYFGSSYCCLEGYQLTATGGPVNTYVWSSGPGPFPSWLSLSSSGVLTGVPPVGATTPVQFSVTVTSGVVGSGGTTAAKLFTINIYPVLLFSSANAAFAMPQGGPLPGPQTITLTGRGGTINSLSTALDFGSAPNPWLTATVSPTTTPATLTLQLIQNAALALAPGNYTALVSVTSSVPGSLPGIVTVTLAVGTTNSCVISPSTMPPFYIGAMVDFQMIGSAGCGATQVWSLVTAGSLPTGLTFGPGGVLYGTPTTAGSYSFALRVQNTATGNTNTEIYTNVAVDLSTSCILWPGASNFLPNGTVGTPYPANSISATPPCTTAGSDNTALWVWTIGAGAPPGLSFSPAKGSTTTDLAGTPTGTGGTYTFTITFTNTNQVGGHNEASASQSFTITIAP